MNDPRSPLDSKYTPFAGHTLERFAAAVIEAQSGAYDQVLDGARHQHLAGVGERRDPRADMNGDAANIVADDFALAGMESRHGL